MEHFIARHNNKIMLLGGLFICWCFYSVVHEGGSVIPRIEQLESKMTNAELKITNIELRMINTEIIYNTIIIPHKHNFFTGEVKVR